ncbi:MAG: hypothetical protein CVT95_04815 [Bacteroidetes bacterium HGW-Bacteroidetes-12]|nr:MAG: hypothetical protein CVT95_04815 [Bacteroidetes bacterium HGW-Bacteroidetes-12]
MIIKEVTTNKLIKQFHQLPFSIYKNDNNWIPHIKQDIEKVFDPTKNKAHANGKIIRWILFDSTQKPIGRIAAFVNFEQAKTDNQPTGGIGFFECVNNIEAAELLFNTAKKWLITHNMEAMDGPINFGEKNMFWGLLVENFIDPNSYGMNYNPSYYQQLFEEYGFQTYYKQFMFKRSVGIPTQKVFDDKSNRILADGNYSISNVKKLNLDEIARNFKTVYNSAWATHDGFKEMTFATSRKIMQNLKPIYDPSIMIFVYYKKEPIAFYINIPELNELFKYVNGNLNWLGKIKFLYHKMVHPPQTMVGIVFGIAKRFQGKGVDGAMIKWAHESLLKEKRYNQTVLTWIGDFNPKMLRIAKDLDAEVYRTYHTYRYLFDRSKPFERCPIIE